MQDQQEATSQKERGMLMAIRSRRDSNATTIWAESWVCDMMLPVSVCSSEPRQSRCNVFHAFAFCTVVRRRSARL